MKKYNLSIIISILVGGLFTIFLTNMKDVANSNKYLILGMILGLIAIILMKKYNILDTYNNDEMRINNIKSIFSILFITILSISTLSVVYLYSIGVEKVSLKKIIFYILIIWLFIVIAHTINKIRIWR